MWVCIVTPNQIKIRRGAIQLTRECPVLSIHEAEVYMLDLRDEFGDLTLDEMRKIVRAA